MNHWLVVKNKQKKTATDIAKKIQISYPQICLQNLTTDNKTVK